MPDVHRLDLNMKWKPGHVAAYLIEGDGLALVDAGVAPDGNEDGEEELRAEFEAVGHEFGDVDAVLVTHPHLDHDGYVRDVVEKSDATVYAYEGVVDTVETTGVEERARRNVREAGIVGEAAEEAVERWLDGVRKNADLLPADSVDVTLSDGETFEAAGVTFEALHTPGHQTDHLCYACDNLLFAGDAVADSFRPIIYNVGFDDGMFDSVEVCYGTFERLADRAEDFDSVYPGHGSVIEDLGAAVEGSVESLDALVEDVHATAAAFDDPTALDVTFARKSPEQEIGHLIFDNIAALGYLEKQGRAESYVEDGVRRFRVTEA